MSKYREIEAFVKTVESESFTVAASQLGVAKSAISRRISELETRLGVQLIIRSTRQLSLTDAGLALYQRATTLLDDWEEAEGLVSDTQSQLAGKIRLAAPLSFGLQHLTDALMTFQTNHPDIVYDIDFSDRKVDLIAEGFDLALRIGVLEDSSLIARKLAPVKMLVVASPDYLDRHGPIETPDQLSTHSELKYSYRNAQDWSFTDDAGKISIAKMPARHLSTSGEFLARLAINGKGIAVLPSFIVHTAIKSKALTPILQDYELTELGLYAVYPPTRHMSARIRALIDFLRAYCGDNPYWDDWRDTTDHR